jgi:hypothetical protein
MLVSIFPELVLASSHSTFSSEYRTPGGRDNGFLVRPHHSKGPNKKLSGRKNMRFLADFDQRGPKRGRAYDNFVSREVQKIFFSTQIDKEFLF